MPVALREHLLTITGTIVPQVATLLSGELKRGGGGGGCRPGWTFSLLDTACKVGSC